MEFRLDDGQLELQQTVARFCADRFPLDDVVAREGAAVDPVVWREMAALGVFGVLLPAESGGMGALEAALVFEQLGSHLAPGPVLWTVLAAEHVEGAATGDVVVGGVDAVHVDEGVEHAGDIDVLVVLHDDAISVHRTADLPPPVMLDPFDPLTPIGRFVDLPDGEQVAHVEAASAMRLLGTVSSAALLVGLASRALDVARGYALERHQFGVPIGSFQAIKHLLADMHVRNALAQSATYAAAAVVHEPGSDDSVRAASAAKLLAAEAAVANAGAAVQVLGGMGFTWDMLPNHLLKRAWVLEHSFGTATAHARSLGSTLAAAS